MRHVARERVGELPYTRADVFMELALVGYGRAASPGGGPGGRDGRARRAGARP